MDDKIDNDLHTFLNNWLSNLTFDERTSLLIGACQMRTRCSGMETQPSTNRIALDRLIQNLGSPRDLNQGDIDIEHGKYPTEPVVVVVSTGNPYLNNDEDGSILSTADSDADDEISTDDELLFTSDDDDDLPKRLEDPFKGINNTFPRFVQKDIDAVTTVLDLTHTSPTKPKESGLRRWRRKAAKNLKKLFTCCVQRDDMCV